MYYWSIASGGGGGGRELLVAVDIFSIIMFFGIYFTVSFPHINYLFAPKSIK